MQKHIAKNINQGPRMRSQNSRICGRDCDCKAKNNKKSALIRSKTLTIKMFTVIFMQLKEGHSFSP